MGSVDNTASSLSIVEATVSDLSAALAKGQTNSVELTVKHLLRIAKYDRRRGGDGNSLNPLPLNAIPVLNTTCLSAAQASDDRRFQQHSPLGPLDGIPCTIKDSYKIQGMTVASGSPAFQNLTANEDAFTVSQIKSAGAVILGRTNMPPMAAGGMQRGVYGRAESPYNPAYLTAAFASGSSNGSATATASSLGVFGMGEETISSGRSPASNNGLVAYTPSRGVISIRGNWPLFPTCDVVVPHARCLADMFALLDVIVAPDAEVSGDFWRGQPWVKLPPVEDVRPKEGKTYAEAYADEGALAGKKVGVPKMYIGKMDSDPAARKVYTRQSVIDLWEQARAVLEGLGATVEEVDFPVVTNFERPQDGTGTGEEGGPPPHRNDIDMCQLMAYAWDDFLAANGDGKVATSLAQIDSATIFPQPPGTLPDKYDADDPLVRHAAVKEHIVQRKPGSPIYDAIPGLEAALRGLEATRKSDWDDWLAAKGLDAVVWPCNGDVGRADADVDPTSQAEAWRNGVLYSNGNCAVRQLGIPTVSTTMGVMADTGMPVNLTFAGKAWDDGNLLRYAYAFEKAGAAGQSGCKRRVPGLTPELATDRIPVAAAPAVVPGGKAPRLDGVQAAIDAQSGHVVVRGKADKPELRSLSVFVDGVQVGGDLAGAIAGDGQWEVKARINVGSAWNGRPEEKGVPDPEKAMVVVLASGANGRSSAEMVFV